MKALHGFRTSLLLTALVLALYSESAAAQAKSGQSGGAPADTPKERDGTHDFDWDIGTWKTHQRRLLKPLTGSDTWVEYQGTDVVRKLWEGGTTGTIEADGPAGHLELFTLRLYNPQSHEWSIYFANSGGGAVSAPAIGEFKQGRGDFYDQETYKGKTILLRFSVFDITADSCHFEQAFSSDGGKTWETNFIVTETRAPDAAR